MEQLHLQAYSAMRISRLLSFFVLLLPLQTFAEVYEVSTTAELREALASAATNGEDDTIILANGTYKTTDDGGGTFDYFSNEANKLTLKGSSAENVIVSGDNQHQILNHESTLEAHLTLIGICFADGSSADDSGGISADYSVEVVDSKFVNNSTQNGFGGGFSSRYLAEVSNSIFQGNSARAGGGFYSAIGASVSNSEFRGNRAPVGGGGNFSGLGGGFATRRGEVSVTDSQFFDNSADSDGGALLLVLTSGLSFISNSKFHNNSAGSLGGAIALGSSGGGIEAYVHNSEFIMNDSLEGSAIRNSYGDLSILNSLFAKNTGSASVYFEVASVIDIYNSIFHKNASDLDAQPSTVPVVISKLDSNYVNVSEITLQNFPSNNIFENIELGFVDELNDNYRLTGGSDLIDMGNTDALGSYAPDTDLGGNARVIGASVDIGPYEYDGEAPPDSDGDGLNDNIDNCPSIANEDQADFDSDGEGDACDSDDDNDGTNDEDDAFPFDDSESLDTDGDGIGNNEDYDDDGDGQLDDSDPQPVIANVFAIDSDGDGVADSIDDYPTDATKQFGSDGDFDGDGFTNDEEVDYCSNPFDKNSQPDIGGLSLPMIHLLTDQ